MPQDSEVPSFLTSKVGASNDFPINPQLLFHEDRMEQVIVTPKIYSLSRTVDYSGSKKRMPEGLTPDCSMATNWLGPMM